MQDVKMKEIRCENAPLPVGPYSQAVLAGKYVFVSGQIPVDPETGQLVDGGVKEQTLRAMQNMENILFSCGLGLGSVVRAEVFLRDINDFAAMNAVYAEKFRSGPLPSRCVVQAAGLPKNAEIEISCIAYTG